MPGKSTTDPMFALRLLMEKYREGQKKLHCVFVDLEKALRQSAQRGIVVLHAKVWNVGEVCEDGAGYV